MKRQRGMTALALRTILTEMNVILAVAGRAIFGELEFAGRLAMALGTLQFAVRTG